MMELQIDKKFFKFTGNSTTTAPLQFHSLCRLTNIDGVAALFQLEVHSMVPNQPVYSNSQLSNLLEVLAKILDTPQGLPPPCFHDHAIHLQPRTQPINVHPYRYPHFQNNEIERLVTEMLK
ncbi:hypothetical protein CFOL_v3_32043 [Cephalotus follicularis]|uniref:Uncharacterized protein n=1 Tax=Cephalotus follicularis TaxID=3775 RepID=A0A1Q3D862_CEPFO|nr:hypothetical protein CFOL_v3_32043 [Cephalotus follicularis]